MTTMVMSIIAASLVVVLIGISAKSVAVVADELKYYSDLNHYYHYHYYDYDTSAVSS